MSTDKKKIIPCPYCGNNPVNHPIVYAGQTLLILMAFGEQFIQTVHHKYISRLSDEVMTLYLPVFTSLRMWGINKDPEKAKTERTKVIWQEAIRNGIEMESLIIYGKYLEQHRAKIHGKWRYFESLPVPPHLLAKTYALMDDKWKLKNLLREKGVPVPFGRSVRTLKEALDVFRQGKKPFITKPRLGSRGRHTTTYIYTEDQLKKGFEIAKKLCMYVIVEEHLFGSVYRGTCVGGKVVGILRGDPPRITGDGRHTIKELITIKNKKKHPKVSDVQLTPMLERFLGRQSLSLKDVLPKGKTIDLSEKIGISYGGYSAEELPKTHPKILHYIKQAGDALNASLVGFDFIIEDITKDPDKQRWGIIEANSLPFIDLHHHPLDGTPINVAEKVWELWK